MYYILYTLLAILIADFLSGVFQWWEDRYGNPSWYFIGSLIIQPNINHHKHPREFTKGSYWNRNYTTIIPSLGLALICYLFSWYFFVLVFLLTSQSNELHCWEHMKTNSIIRFLQKYHILQDVKTHAKHHKNPYDKNYCVMTMIVNPILSYCNFWKCLENTIFFLTGISTRKERELF